MGAWRGLRHLVKQGAVPGTPPKGIRRIPITVKSETGIERTAHRWEPDPHYEHRILTAFRMKAEGKSIVQIHRAVHLYNSLNGYTTFFNNPIYIGTLKFGDLIIEEYCQPIIPRQLWDKVQTIIAAHAARQHINSLTHHPRRATATYSLSGIIKCARCTSPLNGLTSQQRSGKDYRRYRCQNAKQKLTCTAKPIPAALIETLVIKHLTKFFEDETNLINALSLFAENQQQYQTIIAEELASKRAQVSAVRKKLANTSEAIASLGGSATLLKKLRDLELEDSQLSSEISDLENKKNLPVYIPNPAEAKTICQKIITDLHSEDPATIRQTLLGFVHQVLVDRHGKHLIATVELYFDKKKDNQKTVSTNHPSVGAPIYRHSLLIEYQIQKQGHPKPVK
jgi:hypothetical protein